MAGVPRCSSKWIWLNVVGVLCTVAVARPYYDDDGLGVLPGSDTELRIRGRQASHLHSPFQRNHSRVVARRPFAHLGSLKSCTVLTCRDDVTLPRRRLRVLVILRGISYDTDYRQFANNFERTRFNFHNKMVVPWRARRFTVDVGISTYNSEKLSAVLQAYSPVFTHVHNGSYTDSGRTKIHSVLEGLQAAQQHGGASRWDFIAVTRFDISLRQRITEFAIDYGKLNFPWKEKNKGFIPWAQLPRVGDALMMFSSKYLGAVIRAVTQMVEVAQASRDPSQNSCHRMLTYMPDIDLQNEVHFLMQGHCISMWNRPNAVYREAVNPESGWRGLSFRSQPAGFECSSKAASAVLREINVTVRVAGSDESKSIIQYGFAPAAEMRGRAGPMGAHSPET